MQTVTPVLVLDGHLKSALAVVRSLGEKEIPTVVGAERSTGMALHSRYTSQRFVYPAPLEDQSAFVRYVKAEAVRIGGKPIVYALSDATYTALYAHRVELAPYMHLVYPSDSSVEMVFDKAATYSFAKVHGVQTVESYPIFGNADIDRLKDTLVFPLVVKPRQSVSWKNNQGNFGSARFVFSLEDLKTLYAHTVTVTGEAPLVQKYTEGDEYGVEFLAHEGIPYAVTVHKRLRSLSPAGGASVLKETLEEGEVKNQLESYATLLVQKLKWTGPIMVEFKVDSDTREPLLMEINGRFWGSLPLSVFSGVDMPYLYFRALTVDEIPHELVRGRTGVVSRHFLGDLRHLLRVFFAHDPMRSRRYPKRFEALKDFFRTPKGTYADVWSIHDPKPAFFEVADMIKKYIWK